MSIRPTIPDYELVRCIGRGSYGEVWLARNVMGTFRAVKVLFRKHFDEQRPYEREYEGIRKFEPISRSHEGLVDVLHVGRNHQEDYFYYVMELGDDLERGQTIDPETYVPHTLAKRISQHGPLPFDQCLAIGLTLSSALEHLHQQGLIHRDIKPSNIILCHGTAKLADIGLVTGIDATRSFVGTEGFIPPEGPGTPQADVFSLGKVLYEMSTGKDRHDFPDLPNWTLDLPETARLLELNEIVVRACHQDPSKRYASARQLHADLRVLADGKSVRRLRTLERRTLALKKVGVAVAAALLLSGLFYSGFARRYQAKVEAGQRKMDAEVASGAQSVDTGDFLGALPHFLGAFRLGKGDAPQERTQRLRLGVTLAECPKLVQMWFFDKRVNGVTFSPDGESVLAAVSSTRVRSLNVRTGQTNSPWIGQPRGLEIAVYSPDAKSVLTAGEDAAAILWDLHTGGQLFRLPHPASVLSAAFSPRGASIVTTCADGKARIWDAAGGRLQFELTNHLGIVQSAAWSPDERLLVTTSRDKTALLWDLKTRKPLGPPLLHRSWVLDAAFSPDGRLLVTACSDRKARLWEVPSGKELPSAMEHDDAVSSVAFSPDGRFVLTASWDGTARLWSAPTASQATRNPVLRHGDKVTAARFAPDGHRVATSCSDGTVRIWDLASNPIQPRKLPGKTSPDGNWLVQATNESVRVESTTAGSNRSYQVTCPGAVQQAALSPEGRFLLVVTAPANQTVTNSRVLQVWNPRSARPISPPIPFTNSLSQITLSDDGRYLALNQGKALRLFDVDGGKERLPPLTFPQPVSEVGFSPDGTHLLAVTGFQVRVWDLPARRDAFPPLVHPVPASHARFSPNGRLLVTCMSELDVTECSARVWSARTGKSVVPALNHRDGVLDASFSPDSRKVVTASEDSTAMVWDATTGAPVTRPLRHEKRVHAAAFSPDGRWVATVSADKTARVWDAATGYPITPRLRHPTAPTSVHFVDKGASLVTARADGESCLWTLALDHHTSDQLETLLLLLCGSSPALQKRPPATGTAALQEAWEALGRACPQDFLVSGEEVFSWHTEQADQAEQEGRWFATVFHLDRLLALRADDQGLLARRAKAQRAMEMEAKPPPN